MAYRNYRRKSRENKQEEKKAVLSAHPGLRTPSNVCYWQNLVDTQRAIQICGVQIPAPGYESQMHTREFEG